MGDVSRPAGRVLWVVMMHVRFSQITADPRVLAGCLGYLEGEVRPVLESQHGSLGLSLLAGACVAIVESFWATHDHELVWASGETEAPSAANWPGGPGGG